MDIALARRGPCLRFLPSLSSSSCIWPPSASLLSFLAPCTHHAAPFGFVPNFAAMDASELGRWTRFASKGGIGKCTALEDCIAEEAQDLMFMKVRSVFSFQVRSRARRPSRSVLGYL